MSDPTLVILRHAHRDKPAGGEADNGLSEKGREQAERLRKHFEERFSKSERESAVLLTSPKKRCRETIEPLALKGQEVRTSDLLDEGPQIQSRVRRFLRGWMESAPPLEVICSHGDWIPEFFQLATGAFCDLSKGGWVELAREGGQVVIREIRQEL